MAELVPVGVVPGTRITIFESDTPHPGVVLLTPHEINPGPTKRNASGVRGEQGRNTVAGGDDGPSDLFGFGAPTDKERLKLLQQEWEKKLRESERTQSRSSVAQRGGGPVEGWRLRALSPQNEIRISGQDHNTQSVTTSLWKRIPPGTQKAWLEPNLPKGDPYRSPDSATYQAWVRETCIPWLVVEGSKQGLKFAANTKGTHEWRPALRLISLVGGYVRNPSSFDCKTVQLREKGVRLSSRVLGFNELQALSAGAEELYQAYIETLRRSSDKAEVHDAYHRILLHRFLRRRPLTPRGVGPDRAAERRANMLQARRLFVFNSYGCPVSINKTTLEQNGIKVTSLGERDVTLIRGRRSIVEQWTRWLYDFVLEVPTTDCMSASVVQGLEGLAVAGFLG